MGGKGSGGHNKLSADAHRLQGTFKPSRHGREDDQSVPISASDRRRTLAGLDPAARRLAASLLDTFDDWDPSALVTLRLYAASSSRLATITDDTERRRETRINLLLLKAMELAK